MSHKFRALRQIHNYSQEYVSLKLGQSQPNYCKLENGVIQPKLDTLEKMAALYGLPLTDMLAKESTELVALVVARPDFLKLMGRG